MWTGPGLQRRALVSTAFRVDELFVSERCLAVMTDRAPCDRRSNSRPRPATRRVCREPGPAGRGVRLRGRPRCRPCVIRRADPPGSSGRRSHPSLGAVKRAVDRAILPCGQAPAHRIGESGPRGDNLAGDRAACARASPCAGIDRARVDAATLRWPRSLLDRLASGEVLQATPNNLSDLTSYIRGAGLEKRVSGPRAAN